MQGNKKGAPRSRRAFVWLRSSDLELEANGQLNLALAEQCAVSTRHLLERGVEDQALRAAAGRAARGRERIDRGVHAGYLGAVEEVEGFAEHFDLGLLSNREPARNAEI